MTDLLRAERDAIALLGLLGRADRQFDPPLGGGGGAAPTHRAGLNIFGCVLDNCDGELLAVDRNTIHTDGSPLQHAEQRAVRSAIARVLAKRPRPDHVTVEQYYRGGMLRANGSGPGDALRQGATCYTTLEPCPMCSGTLLQARMQRVVFVLSDMEYGGAWRMLKERYFPADASSCESMEIDAAPSELCHRAADLLGRLRIRARELRLAGGKDMHALDGCRDLLHEASGLLAATDQRGLCTRGGDLERNARTLAMFKALVEP